MGLHRDLPYSENHISHALEFADEAARLAYVGTAQDVGKIARQVSDNSFWLLTSIGTWVQLGFKLPRIVEGGATTNQSFSGNGPWTDMSGMGLTLQPGWWAINYSGWVRFTGTNDRIYTSIFVDGVEQLMSRRQVRRASGNVYLTFVGSAVVYVPGPNLALVNVRAYPVTGTSSAIVRERHIWAIEGRQ